MRARDQLQQNVSSLPTSPAAFPNPRRYIDEFDGVDGEDDIKAEIFARGTLPECNRRVR